MAADIQRTIIRVAVDAILSRATALTDALTAASLRMWQAEDVEVQVGIFKNGVIAADITNFDSIAFVVKDPENLDGSALISATALKTGSVSPQVDLDQSVTQAHWDDGTEQHAVFVLTAAETAIELAGLASRTLTAFFWGTTGDTPARRIPLGSGPIRLLDSGYGDIGAITVAPVGARMKSNKLQIRNPADGLYYDFVARSDGAGNQVGSMEGAGEA